MVEESMFVIRLFLFFICSVFVCDVFSCDIVVDDVGNKITLSHPAERIISLAPDLTEILFFIGAGKQVIGVVSGSDYPLAAKNIPLIATFNSVEIEKIMALQPDLIVAWTETNYAVQLKKLGIPIYLSHQRKLMDVASTMRKLG